jgi:uncharacterized protein (TIGR02466 family)
MAFPMPIMHYNTGIDLEKYITVSSEIEFRHDGNMHSSIDTYILDMPQFKDLKLAVEQAIESFAREVCSIKNNFKFYITNSWYNKMNSGDVLHKHFHNNSLISGCLYLRTNNKSGHIVFHNDSPKDQLFSPLIQMEYDSLNIFNSSSTAFSPSSGDIVVFPSHMFHSVEKNESTETRHCIAFNAFVKGSFGTLHKLEL